MRGNRLFKLIDGYIGRFLLFYLGTFIKLIEKIWSLRSAAGISENVLIIKLSAMGDSVLLLPVISSIKEYNKTGKITVVCTSINREIFELSGLIDDIVELKLKSLMNPVYLLNIVRILRRREFNAVFDFDQWLRISALITLLSGSRKRYGFRTPGQFKHIGFTRRVVLSYKEHEQDNFFRLIETAGISRKEGYLFKAPGTAVARLLDMKEMAGVKKYAVIHPGCGRHGYQREWPAKRYAQIADWLYKDFGIRAVLTGGKGEGETAAEVILRASSPVINMQGKLSLAELAALLENALLLISGNTGVMHLAAAEGTPCIALHGPTDYNRWGPVGSGHRIVNSPEDCSPCLNLGFEYGCAGRKCMESIDTEYVKDTVRELL